VGKIGSALPETDGRKLRSRLNGQKKGRDKGGRRLARRLLVRYGTISPRTSRWFFFWAAVNPWISPIQPPMVFVTEISGAFSPGIFWVICSHAANSQIGTLSLFFPRGQEAHQQRALRDSTVFLALDWVYS
jgi:hypothetical protein